MIPAALESFRTDYRQQVIGGRYSGWGHLAFTAITCLALILWCISGLDGVTGWELIVIPFTILYANLSEYLGHKGPMHHPTRPITIIYQRHTLHHHEFFTQDHMTFEGTNDFHAVLFPPVMLLFFTVCFALPVGVVIWWLTTANVALLFGATALGYFLNYELLHFAYHMRPDSWVGRLPFMAVLRRHHTVHHDKALMARYNFNITYPICDWLFSTWYREDQTGNR
ncbi:MAG: hypothetical protein ACE5EM_02995 [Sphingomonadales bacterium]